VKTDHAGLCFFAEVAGDSFADHRFQFVERIGFRENGVTKGARFVAALRGL
jgi:hypothetical protein